MRTLIVDDEPLARDVLRFFLADEPDAVVVAECEDGEQALDAIRRESPDLVFLDVQMPGWSGIEVLRRLEPERPPAIVFVTAFDEHAVEAFELHAVDYLLKPVEESRFRQAVSRVRRQLTVRDLQRQADRLRRMLATFESSRSGPIPPPAGIPHETPDGDRLLVRGRRKISVVRLGNLDWVESAGDYVYLHCGPERHLLRQTLGNLESELDPRRFRRIHRTTLVNLERVDEIRFTDHGELQLRLQDGTLLKVSRTYRRSLADFLEE